MTHIKSLFYKLIEKIDFKSFFKKHVKIMMKKSAQSIKLRFFNFIKNSLNTKFNFK